MQSADISAVPKYFFLNCLDEQIAYAITLRALPELQHTKSEGQISRARWIPVLEKWRTKLSVTRGKPWPNFEQARGFTLPREFDQNAWQAFLRSADSTEVDAVLLCRILGISEEEVAEGFGVTVGTIRFRLGRGLRQLGGYLEL